MLDGYGPLSKSMSATVRIEADTACRRLVVGQWACHTAELECDLAQAGSFNKQACVMEKGHKKRPPTISRRPVVPSK